MDPATKAEIDRLLWSIQWAAENLKDEDLAYFKSRYAVVRSAVDERLGMREEDRR